MSLRRRLAFCAAALTIGLGVPRAWGQFPAPNDRASRAADDGLANENSREPSLSADGRFVAFASDASNLVAGDTNGNSDVFVYDTLSGVTERVSLSWKGLEARGESFSPSISGDGRFVAFASDAWNLYRDALNFGNNVVQIFVRDRLLGTTTRLTVAKDGGDPSGGSSDPAISDDGRRVAFLSWAANLDPADTNGRPDIFLWDATDGLSLVTAQVPSCDPRGRNPALSGDGNVVAFRSLDPLDPNSNGIGIFVRDLTRADVEYEWVGSGDHPRLSHDGRYVSAFGRLDRRRVVYLYDREMQTRMLASPTTGDFACGPPENRFPCEAGKVLSHDLSADGRYVVYSTDASNVLAATEFHGDHVYAYDRDTGRVRRIGVGPGGRMADGCSVDPAISADGQTVAFRTNAINVAPGRGKPIHDIVYSRWQCVDDDTCRRPSTCAPKPRDCAEATTARLRLRRHAPGGTRPDRLSFRWQAPPLDEPFPHPEDGADYQMCLYVGNGPHVEMDVAANADGKVRDNALGFRIRSKGATALIARNGDKRARLTFRGEGPLIDAPYLPLAAPSGVTVQVHDTISGRCFGAHFPPESIRRNRAGEETQGRFPDGRFAADLRSRATN